MKKQILKSALIAMAGVGLLAGSALALPWDSLGGDYLVSTSMDFFTPTDFTTNVTGNSLFQLEYESAGYDSNFGLFYVNPDQSLGGQFQIFAKEDEPLTKRTITYTNIGGQFKVTDNYSDDSDSTNDDWVNFNETFGFYYDVYTGNNQPDPSYTFFTLASLNTQDVGIEHITTAYSKNNKDVYIYLDDQLSRIGADKDWNDMNVYADDLQAQAIPEPATMLLFGTGILGLTGIARRRKTN